MLRTFQTTTLLTITASLLLGAACGEEQGPSEDVPEVYQEGPPLRGPGGKGDAVLTDLPAYQPLADWASFERPFEALFAPDDPVSTVELTMIDSIIEARRADTAEFSEGKNPYRIRYAVYNLRNPQIVARLIEAEAAGVDVQILIESKQLDPAKTWNTADEQLAEAGLELVDDHRNLSPEQMDRADLIGIVDGGLMHLKARIFERPEEAIVLSGSMNPGDNAVMNEETLHIIRQPTLVERYQKAYQDVLEDNLLSNQWDDQAAVNVMFTPARGDRASARLFDWLQQEDEQILLMVFSLRDITAPGHDASLVDLLGVKARAGIPVYVITDRKQSDGVDADGNPLWRNDNTEDRLRAAGVHVYEATNRSSPFTAMHHKVGIFGKTNIRVVTDAANWTFSGLGSSSRSARNVESQLFIDSAKLDDNRTGRRYLAQWLRVLQRYADQSKEAGEPSFEEALSDLSDRSGWPSTPLRFEAHQAETSFGEEIFVRGDHHSLGDWGEGSMGHQLGTDAERYPSWSSAQPILMPVGLPFAWKLVAGRPDSGQVRWESGDNHLGIAQPTALHPDDVSLHEGSWR